MDTNPNHFAVATDLPTFPILIKEKMRGWGATTGTVTIDHELHYFPFILVFAEVASGRYHFVDYQFYSYNFRSYFDTSVLSIVNNNGTAGVDEFRYFIFYDNVG